MPPNKIIELQQHLATQQQAICNLYEVAESLSNRLEGLESRQVEMLRQFNVAYKTINQLCERVMERDSKPADDGEYWKRGGDMPDWTPE